MSVSSMDKIIKITNSLHTRPWTVLIAFLAITLLAMGSAGKLQINATPYMIGHDHPSRIADHDVKALFNNTGEQAFIAVVNKGGDVFNSESLSLVHDLTKSLEKITLIQAADLEKLKQLAVTYPGFSESISSIVDGELNASSYYSLQDIFKRIQETHQVDSASVLWMENLLVRTKPVRKVRSFVTMENITPMEDGIDIHPLMKRPKTDLADIASFKAEVLANPMYLDGLVAKDASATSVQIEFNIAEDDSPAMLMAYDAIMSIINDTQMGNNTLHLSGPPMIASQTAASMEKDNQTLLPGVLLVILAILLFSFGRLQGMIVPLLIAILSLIWTLGVMSAAGVKQNIITSMLPVFIIAIAVCDAIHFLSDYYRHLPQDPNRRERSDAAAAAIKQLFWPMFVTTVTTALGFMSLAWTEVTFIQEFGVFVGIGVIIAWAITIFFLPTMVVLWKTNPPKYGFLSSKAVDGAVAKMSGVSKYAKFAVIGMVLLMAGSGVVISQLLKVDNQVIGYFEETTQIRVDDKVFNERFAGTNPNSILIESNQVDAFKQPQFIEALEKIDARLKSHEIVGFTYGIPDFVKRLNQTLNNDMSDAAFSLPKEMTPELLSQYFLLYENGNGRDLFDVVDRRYQNARILSVMKSDRSSEVSVVIDDVMAYAQTVLPEGTTIRVAGYGEILVSTTNAVVWGQVNSLVLAGILITLVVMGIFRSPGTGLLVPVPLLLTLLGVFAIMALTGTDLDIGTSIIAAISFGIGIDYSIHIVSALKASPADNHMQRIQDALRKCGKPILINTLALGLGFLVLTMSGYQALINLGYFISLTMCLCAIFSLLILPSLVVSLVSDEEEKEELPVAGSGANV